MKIAPAFSTFDILWPLKLTEKPLFHQCLRATPHPHFLIPIQWHCSLNPGVSERFSGRGQIVNILGITGCALYRESSPDHVNKWLCLCPQKRYLWVTPKSAFHVISQSQNITLSIFLSAFKNVNTILNSRAIHKQDLACGYSLLPPVSANHLAVPLRKMMDPRSLSPAATFCRFFLQKQERRCGSASWTAQCRVKHYY